MLDIIQQQEQEYPILGPRRYANRGQKGIEVNVSVLYLHSIKTK